MRSKSVMRAGCLLAFTIAGASGCSSAVTAIGQQRGTDDAPKTETVQAGTETERAASQSSSVSDDDHLRQVYSKTPIDLSYPFDESTIYWPTEKGFQLELGDNGINPKGYYYAANRFRAAEHGGTHIDAPIHFFEGRHTVDQIPLDRLIGEGVLIDVSEQCSLDRDYLIGVADLRAWEQENDRLLIDVIVLLKTGYGNEWPSRPEYLGTDLNGAEGVAHLHFPGLDPEAAQWLVDHRSIKAIGIDTASIDYGQSTLFECHVTLCGSNVPIFENVANLDQLTDNTWVIALPMKIGGGSGGPLRIIGFNRE